MRIKKLFYPKILLIVTILFCGCSWILPQKAKFFEDYDLSTGEFKLLVFGQEGMWIDDYRDFYIDDIEVLKKMQKQWVFRFKSSVMACGFGYRIMFVDRDRVINEAWVNIQRGCEYMVWFDWLRFPKRFLLDHKAHFRRMTETEREYFLYKFAGNY